MRIMIDLPSVVVDSINRDAEVSRRSKKNLLESILMAYYDIPVKASPCIDKIKEIKAADGPPVHTADGPPVYAADETPAGTVDGQDTIWDKLKDING